MATATETQTCFRPLEAREFSDWHERSIEHLLTRSGLLVQREPQIMGKTPDLLAQPARGAPFVVECMARLPDPSHFEDLLSAGVHICDGHIREVHENVYWRLDEKATKYRAIAERTPYVIALFDATCGNSLDNALDMVLSPYAPMVERDHVGWVTGKHYNTLWRTPTIPAALFALYPHLSGLLYSRWPRDHYYIPNPYAINPIDGNMFRFAQVPAVPDDTGRQIWRPRPAIQTDDSPSPPVAWQPLLDSVYQNASLQELFALP